MKAHKYTAEQISWLSAHRPTTGGEQLATAFNDRFNSACTANALKRTCLRNNIKSLSDGKFSGGQTSWNAGKKGLRQHSA